MHLLLSGEVKNKSNAVLQPCIPEISRSLFCQTAESFQLLCHCEWNMVDSVQVSSRHLVHLEAARLSPSAACCPPYRIRIARWRASVNKLSGSPAHLSRARCLASNLQIIYCTFSIVKLHRGCQCCFSKSMAMLTFRQHDHQ